ncbi:hypothetical protein LOK46_29705 [Methylobacterium sp. NMS14P]|uniref:hypothetical protein n=1 Tax=Methylobacterium sp. NMS14P TaxID=2894310 RepID=UPI0023590ECD|nr:hypothetical protein [Methylobacterium sp. NMS14P]WCS25243.1 hypothetical protein LOK46_29705 [Methylobacterium sp. NMS14P]
MSRTIAFPVPAGVVEGLDYALAERRKLDPATPSRNLFLAQLVADAVAAEIRNLKDRTGRKQP